MDVIVSLKTTDFSFMLSSNAPGRNVMLFDVRTVMFCIFEQPVNKLASIIVTPSGMVTDVKLVHFQNALLPIDVTLSGMVTDVKLVQESNAL